LLIGEIARALLPTVKSQRLCGKYGARGKVPDAAERAPTDARCRLLRDRSGHYGAR